MILDKIVKAKKQEVQLRKKTLPLASFKSKLTNSNRDFKKAISKPLSLIAEIKKGSPSEGIINKNFNLENIAKTYQKNNKVKAISVLTDWEFFFMAPTCIAETKKLTKKPILRKDFIIDEYQIYESRLYGADAILLIAEILPPKKINKFIKIAKTYNMDCLVEVHTKEELGKVLKTNAEIVGINNRNLKTFKISINTTLNLKKLIPKNKMIVSESGFKTKADIKKIKTVNAVLIGTTFMKAKNINKKIGELLK